MALDHLASLDDEQTENRWSEKVGCLIDLGGLYGRCCRVGAAGAGEFGMDNLKNPILGGWVGPVCEQLDFGAVRCTRQYRLVVSLLLRSASASSILICKFPLHVNLLVSPVNFS